MNDPQIEIIKILLQRTKILVDFIIDKIIIDLDKVDTHEYKSKVEFKSQKAILTRSKTNFRLLSKSLLNIFTTLKFIYLLKSDKLSKIRSILEEEIKKLEESYYGKKVKL